MSEFTSEHDHSQENQKNSKNEKLQTAPPQMDAPSKAPTDAPITKWLGTQDVCSGSNAPLVCESPSVSVPAPFNVRVPRQESVAPPAPLNWAASVLPIATCPTEVMSGEPAYKPAFEAENLEPYKQAFSSTWADVRTRYNGLVALHSSVKEKERTVIPMLNVDASTPVGAGVQGIDAGKSFVGGKLKPSLSKIDSAKLSPELRAQIFKAQDKVKTTELDIANKRDLVTNANASLVQAAIAVDVAKNNIEIGKTDTQVENLVLDKEQVKRDLETFKAKVKMTVESVKAITSFINCWSDPTKVFGNVIGAVNQSATAGGAIAEANATIDANAKLNALDGEIRGLKTYQGRLRATNAEKVLESAMVDVEKRANDLKIAVRTMEASKLVQRDAYREMSALIEKAGAASGLNAKDRKALAGAVEAVPKIEMIEQQLQGIDEGLQLPPYDEASGIGANMASNVGVFTHALSVMKGNREYVAQLKALWGARRASVLAVVDQSVSVAGAE